MNVLVSSAGRRGALVRLIRETLAPYGGQVFAVDMTPWSSACQLADGWGLMPPFDDPRYFDSLVEYSLRHNIQLIIPTHDRELPLYAQWTDQLGQLGIRVAVSGPRTVALATDKLSTYHFLVQHRLPTAERVDPRQLEPHCLPFPVVVKPRFGSGSQGVQFVDDREALDFYWKRSTDAIVQRRAVGHEFTVNFFVDRSGECVTAVPHLRLETRGGEVSKCLTVKHPELMRLARQIANRLPDAWGPLCFQAIVESDDSVRIIEINARFGGGYPVAHRAGANFLKRLIADTLGKNPAPAGNDWIDGLAMSRWEDAVFLHASEMQRVATTRRAA